MWMEIRPVDNPGSLAAALSGVGQLAAAAGVFAGATDAAAGAGFAVGFASATGLLPESDEAELDSFVCAAGTLDEPERESVR